MPSLFGSPLSFFDALRVWWWRARLTPTARVRDRHYHQSRNDQRSTVESFQIARQHGAY